MRPLMSLPRQMVSREFESLNSSDSRIWRRLISSRRDIGDFDSHRGLAGNALDQNRLGLQAQAQIFGERGDAAVLDAGLGFEFEGGDHRAGVDLHYIAVHVELFELGLDAAGDLFELEGIVRIAAGDFVEQIGGGQPVFRMLGNFGNRRETLGATS